MLPQNKIITKKGRGTDRAEGYFICLLAKMKNEKNKNCWLKVHYTRRAFSTSVIITFIYYCCFSGSFSLRIFASQTISLLLVQQQQFRVAKKKKKQSQQRCQTVVKIFCHAARQTKKREFANGRENKLSTTGN